ncbi:MAG: 5-nucleosidase [Flavipsychrobacter sp.]|nr:5-nucleosidase [Flavipsychrobacter sp.]
MAQKIIGIMGAMPEEINEVVHLLSHRQEVSLGMRTYYTGSLHGISTVVVFSRWGKTAASATVSALILEFKITDLIFTGVAGGIDPALNIGDIAIASRLVQHDMDARPLMPRYEIPLLGKTFFEASPERLNIAATAVKEMIDNRHLHALIDGNDLEHFGITNPQLFIGDIASGDKFFAANEDKQQLAENLPGTLCVEMEGAAVAQVCYEYNIPFTIIRTISDTADHKSVIDFPAFIHSISSKYSLQVIKNIFAQLH